MTVGTRPKVVLLGMMSHLPFAGVVWQTIHYLIGFQRLGYDPYYVEAHGSTPTKLMQNADDDGVVRAAAFIAATLGRFDLGDRWAYHAPHAGNRYFGMTESELLALYREAAVIINLHGSTVTLPEHSATGRLVYLETDPVAVQVQLHQGDAETAAYLEPHCAFFTFGENYGRPGCSLPLSDKFHFRPTRQPVVMDFWKHQSPAGDTFTTIANWKQLGRDLTLNGETYYWSKHREFRKHLNLPRKAGEKFELALSMSSIDDTDLERVTQRGWRVTDALAISYDLDRYRDYITGSRGEFTVAKDQNVRLQTGWFSDRSATYLAAGRPVITQSTAFDQVLPTGEGLFAFLTTKEIVHAVARIEGDYQRHSRSAVAIAREYFAHDVVLGRLLSDLGLSQPMRQSRAAGSVLSADLVIKPASRWPTMLEAATVEIVMASPIPPVAPTTVPHEPPHASIVLLTFNSLVFTKICLASVLANTGPTPYEVIIVDNRSTDGTVAYLRDLELLHDHVTVVYNDRNLGFAAANNQALAIARGEALVLLNNDTIVPPGWLQGLTQHLDDPAIGLVGPVTNRASNEAEVPASYSTYGELLSFVEERAQMERGNLLDLDVLTMYCLAMRRDAYERIGPLDERFEIGMFEDDDYSLRAREANYRVVCVEDSFVHHFGQASLGRIGGSTGGFGTVFKQNRQRWEQKWARTWKAHRHRTTDTGRELAGRIRAAVNTWLPHGAIVAVVSHGDDELLQFDGRVGWHFPQTEDGTYVGSHPAGSRDAIAHLREVRAKGAQFLIFPQPSLWWLSHYQELTRHLETHFTEVDTASEDCRVFAVEIWRNKPVPVGED